MKSLKTLYKEHDEAVKVYQYALSYRQGIKAVKRTWAKVSKLKLQIEMREVN